MTDIHDKNLLKGVLQFFSTVNHWDEASFIFEKVFSFFKEHFDVKSMYAVSLNNQAKGDGAFEVTWNSEGQESGTTFLSEMFSKDFLEQGQFPPFFFREFQREHYCFFTISQEDSLSHFLLFPYAPEKVPEEMMTAFALFLQSSSSHLRRIKQLKSQTSLIHIDDITGLFNQRKLYKDLADLIKKHEKTGENFALLFIDIDHFKSVNDNFGHLVGTKILTELGKVLRCTLHETDYLYRYGGDEFVAIVPRADAFEARQIGGRVLHAVKDEHFVVDNSEEIFKISISVGIATFPSDAKNGREVLELADRMMYRAKNRGRGCVCLAGDFYTNTRS